MRHFGRITSHYRGGGRKFVATAIKGRSFLALFAALFAVVFFISQSGIDQLIADAEIDPPPGMIAWWTGDDVFTDLVSGNEPAIIGDPTFEPGVVLSGMRFDGNDGLIVPDDPLFDFEAQESFTIDAWVRVDGQGSGSVGHDALVDKRSTAPGTPQRGYTLGVLHPPFAPDGSIIFNLNFREFFGSDNTVSVSTNPTSLGAFHFVTAVVDRDAGIAQIYLDGVLHQEADISHVGDISNTSRLFIGHHTTDVSTAIRPLNGVLDEVEIFDRALSAEEILAIFDAGSAGKIKPTPPCTLDLELSYIDTTLTMDFNLGTPEPAIWSTWLFVGTTPIRLWSAPIPVFEPPVSFPVPIPGFPSLGKVIVLTWLFTSEGVTCSDWVTIDTGEPSSAVPSISELRELLPELNKVLWNVH